MPNEGMFCAICKKYSKPPPSVLGVSKPISVWVKGARTPPMQTSTYKLVMIVMEY